MFQMWHSCSAVRSLGSQELGAALWEQQGSSTFSLRWISVKGMLCLSWGLLFLVSCWMGSAMSATKDSSR